MGIRWSTSSWDFAAGRARPNTVRAYEASPGPGATDDLVETLSREGLTAAWSLEHHEDAIAHDLKVFFTVVVKDPVEVRAADVFVAEQPPSTIVGDRTTAGSRGPIDHYGIAVASSGALSDVRDRLLAAGAHVGDIQRLGESWSLFFRDPDGMELEVCAPL